MKKALLLLVSIVGLGIAGYYAAAWYGTQQWLERVQDDLADVGILKWQGIEPSLEGRVRIEDLRLTLFELNQPFRIGAVTVEAYSPLRLLEWLLDDTAPWPAPFRVEVSEARLVLQPDLLKSWVSDATPALPQWPRPWQLRACGERIGLSSVDLMAMGIDTIDLDLALDWDRTAEGIPVVRGEFNAGPLGSLDFKVESTGMPERWSELEQGLPRHWRALQLVLRDGGLMRRVSALCAQDRFATPDDWATMATAELKRELADWGITPSIQLMALYRQWLQEGGVISLELPSTEGDPLDGPVALAAYLKDAELVTLYNDQRVPDIAVEFAAADFARQQAPVPPPATPSETVAPAPRADFRDTPVASAHQWLERPVRVTLTSGHSVEGRLSAINERQLQVTRTLEGGEVAYPVERQAVARFQVWRTAGEEPRVPVEEPRAPATPLSSVPATN